MHLVSLGDFIDLTAAFHQKRASYFLQRFNISFRRRTASVWESIDHHSSDWWLVPAIRRRWNKIISGDEHISFVHHVCTKYFSGARHARMISIGSGGGTSEIEFALTPEFDDVRGIDISPHIVDYANRKAERLGARNVQFLCADALQYAFQQSKYDVVLFNSSLHHFRDPAQLLQKVKPALKRNGILIINEYAGPNRFQYSLEQTMAMNSLLQKIPLPMRKIKNSFLRKDKVYRPGTIRQYLSDPSEAAASEDLLPALSKHFACLEFHPLGGNLLHPLLKGIAHHFIPETEENLELLKTLTNAEDEFILRAGKSDFVFGVYTAK